MARLCSECRQPVAPVNECLCLDEDDADGAQAWYDNGEDDVA